MSELRNSLDQVLGLIKGVWLKKRYIIICSWLICPIGWFSVSQLPDQYTSDAKVYVDTQTLLKPLLEGLAVRNDPEQQINVMVRTLTSRPNLERVARMTDLDLTAQTDQDLQNILTALEQSIKVKSTRKENLYTISYTSNSAEQSKNVVQSLLNVFVENTLGENRQETDTVSTFLDEQIASYEARLLEAEQRLSQFKRANSELIFANEGGLYARIEQTKEELDTLDLMLDEQKLKKQEKQAVLNRMFSAEQKVELSTKYDTQIAELNSSLNQLLIRFTEAHPEVIQTKELLAGIEAKRDKEIAQIQDHKGGIATTTNETLVMMQSEIAEAESMSQSLQKQKDLKVRKLQELEAKMSQVPNVEAALTALNRDYGITKAQYEQLLQRRESAEISRKADMSSSDIQFKVIEPPLLPVSPSGPNRLIFMAGVLVAGFGAGIGIAFLLSQIVPLVHSTTNLYQLTGIPVMAAISHIDHETLAKTNSRKFLVFIISNLALLFILAGFIGVELGLVNIELSSLLGGVGL